MLTSNTVVGDSRVQKAAWAAANAGWDTLVVGAAPGAVRLDDHLGLARVVRVPVGSPWAFRPGAVAAVARLWLRGRFGLRRRAYRLADRGALGRVIWLTLVRDAAWRRTQPQLVDLERALLPEIVVARPALLHAHDYSVLALAVAAADAVERAGHPRPKIVYDAHELLAGVRGHDPVWRASLLAMERAAVPYADAVVTVSDTLADRLVADFGLPERPTVVLNAPVVEELEGAEVTESLRGRLGLAAGVPLAVYSGAVAPQRGLATLVEALRLLPGVHAALVAAPGNRHVAPLQALAARLGVADRFHVTPYVAAPQVTAFLSSADLGVIPILHYPNHEIALITKYFEYVHAGLPIVVSDVEAMAKQTRDLGNGEVFPAGDATGLAAAVRAVLADRERYAASYDDELLGEWTWQRQMTQLLALYSRLAGWQPQVPAETPTFASSGLAAPARTQETG